MGAIFALYFFIILLICGLSGVSLGIAGIIIFSIFSKKGKSFAKPLKIVSIVLLVISSLTTLVPVGFFSIIFMMNTLPPEDYVETGIVIEEEGYQDTKFTADGVVYETLDLYINDYDRIGEPIFSYKTSGLLNGSQCGNYYTIDNPNNFTLVSDTYGTLFAPITEKEEILNYYLSSTNQDLYFWGETKEILLEEDISNKLQTFFTEASNNENCLVVVLEEVTYYDFVAISKDQLILVKYHTFVTYENNLYYVYESTLNEEHQFEDTLILIDGEIESYFENNIFTSESEK